jgi:hypothetical protein
VRAARRILLTDTAKFDCIRQLKTDYGALARNR